MAEEAPRPGIRTRRAEPPYGTGWNATVEGINSGAIVDL
jgi:hypothetical protein